MLSDHPGGFYHLFGMGAVMINDPFIDMRAKKITNVLLGLVQDNSVIHTRVIYGFLPIFLTCRDLWYVYDNRMLLFANSSPGRGRGPVFGQVDEQYADKY